VETPWQVGWSVGAGWDDMVVKMDWVAAVFSIWLGDAGVVGWFQAI